MKDLIHDLLLLFGVEHKEPSLLAQSIIWSTNAIWIERLVAHRQLDNWLSNKHTNENESTTKNQKS